jgi:hypothetical protein
MIDCHAPLSPHLLSLPVGNRIRPIPPHAPQDNCSLALTALEVEHAASPPPHWLWRNIAKNLSDENLRQNPLTGSNSPQMTQIGEVALAASPFLYNYLPGK